MYIKFIFAKAMSREVLKTKTQTSLVDDDKKQMFCQVVTVKVGISYLKGTNSIMLQYNFKELAIINP